MSAMSWAGASGSSESAAAGSCRGFDLTNIRFAKEPWSEMSAGNAGHQLWVHFLTAEIGLEGIFLLIVPPLARDQKGMAHDAAPPLAAQAFANPASGSASCWLVTRALLRRTGPFFLFQVFLWSPSASFPPSFLPYAWRNMMVFLISVCIFQLLQKSGFSSEVWLRRVLQAHRLSFSHRDVYIRCNEKTMLGEQLFFSAWFQFSPGSKCTPGSAHLLAAARIPALWVADPRSPAESRCRNGWWRTPAGLVGKTLGLGFLQQTAKQLSSDGLAYFLSSNKRLSCCTFLLYAHSSRFESLLFWSRTDLGKHTVRLGKSLPPPKIK